MFIKRQKRTIVAKENEKRTQKNKNKNKSRSRGINDKSLMTLSEKSSKNTIKPLEQQKKKQSR